MKAIISDIHGNLDALKAVLEDIERLKIKEIICLGDVVGYGPEPRECLTLLKDRVKFTILGNHEEAVLVGTPPRFTPRAKRALEWTRKILLEDTAESAEVRETRKKHLESFMVQNRVDGVQFVHGSPRDPTREYVMPRDAAALGTS